MFPKNIQEDVAERVIAHLMYRDAEMAALYEALEQSDIFKCSTCNLFFHSNYAEHCQVCDMWYCKSHNEVDNISTWNLSGTDMCTSCIPKTCHNCAYPGFIACVTCRYVWCSVCCEKYINTKNVFQCPGWECMKKNVAAAAARSSGS